MPQRHRNAHPLSQLLILLTAAALLIPWKLGNSGPTHDAAKVGDIFLIQKELEEGNPIDARNMDGKTALHVAAANGHVEAIRFLVSNGADVNAKASGYFQATPLHMAVKSGDLAATENLLKLGANIEAVSSLGFTPLHIAADVGNKKTIALLLKEGANVHARAKEGQSPMFRAANNHDDPELLKVFISYGANILERIYISGKEARLSQGFTLLHNASAWGKEKNLKFLLKSRLDPNAKTDLGHTPLHYAVMGSQIQSIKILLDYGADPTMQDKDGKTPLSLAKEKKNFELISAFKAK